MTADPSHEAHPIMALQVSVAKLDAVTTWVPDPKQFPQHRHHQRRPSITHHPSSIVAMRNGWTKPIPDCGRKWTGHLDPTTGRQFLRRLVRRGPPRGKPITSTNSMGQGPRAIWAAADGRE